MSDKVKHLFARLRCRISGHAARGLVLEKASSLGSRETENGLSANWWIESAHWECRRCGHQLGEWTPDDGYFGPVIRPESFGFQR